MKTVKQEIHEELAATMKRAREWMVGDARTNEELERWYPVYKKLVNEITQLEEEMWGPIPW